jgi:hypothetical protein
MAFTKFSVHGPCQTSRGPYFSLATVHWGLLPATKLASGKCLFSKISKSGQGQRSVYSVCTVPCKAGWWLGRGGAGIPTAAPGPIPCRTLYCASVQFANFVNELLVNIASGQLFPSQNIYCVIFFRKAAPPQNIGA